MLDLGWKEMEFDLTSLNFGLRLNASGSVGSEIKVGKLFFHV